ncbi:FAD-binding protein [Metallosphaera tengchongensis]|uniref:FAD-binding protein n=1 Tax=Metallosphaera tengchongensis TaxID=1532350 RepID=A0A6N0NZJ0_9CREN|nr:4Fe-4S dicluster domain-containing protein [Metallosphaera tengchongensis]QKR00551.1 FAD-binding protein [Metallosphaera tengchongensis]
MLLDASIFSRALSVMGLDTVRKQLIQGEREVIVGKGTSMSGSILQFMNPKVISPPSRFEDGSVFRIESNSGTYSRLLVPSGVSFKDLIERLSRDGLFPALFPLYLEGTVGGFVATNGSGFGSYKFGFVNFRKTVHELKDNMSVSLLAVNYSELIETREESKFSWAGIVGKDGEVFYYVPTIYSSLVNKKERSLDTMELIKELSSQIEKTLTPGKIPVCLRSDTLHDLPFLERTVGYVINYNSPSRMYVQCGSIDRDKLDDLFSFLKKNPRTYPFPNLQDYNELQKILINKFDNKLNLPKKVQPIKVEYLDALKCVSCGKCLDSCLAYKVTRDFTRSPPGKFSRLFTGYTEFEACFGCMECQDVCPEGIKISAITEVLPTLAERKNPSSIDTPKVSLRVREMEKMVEAKYRNRAPVMLFVGCASKYDMQGVEGFLMFLYEHGEGIKLSPRVRVIDGMCCGYEKYIAGDVEGAKQDVARIKELKEKQTLQDVYFLCPEGLYVYNKLSGDRGVLAYELLKDKVQGDVHAGCWARKLGYEGKDKECAGLFMTTYHGKPVPMRNKNLLTICPFSTWKFNTTSVYGSFSKGEIKEQVSKEVEINEEELIEWMTEALRNSVLMSGDDVAERANSWSLGGKSYFVLLTTPLIRKRFTGLIIQRVSLNRDIKNYFMKLVNNSVLLIEKADRWSEIINGMNFDELAEELIKRVANSSRLEYESRNLVSGDEFKKALRDEVLKKVVTPNVIQEIVKNVAYS